MIVTLDNLQMPCLISGRAKILLFRSNDTPRVEMSDGGADRFKDSIGSARSTSS
jgi:hypothetical protein